MQLAPGTLLDGYEILGLLGSGGMGEVYRARDPILKREVAIKVLPASVAQDPDRLRRFEQEAQATAALNHPNILAIHRFGVFEGSPYLVSELLEGQTLRQIIERGPLAARKAIDTGVQIARGLAAAHEKGIAHRDLKPENLFVLKDGRVKILDFGLAKLMQPQTDSDGSGPTLTHVTDPGVIMGTAGYMSPEQVRGQKVDHRTDIFAFGAILYEMLTGTRAFHRGTAVETMTAILNEDPPSISQLAQTTPPGLQRVVHRCLEKNPEQRFQSASDLAFALEALSESGGSAPAAAMPAVKRRPRRLLIAASSVAVLLALGLIGYWFAAGRSSTAPLRVTEYSQITHASSIGEVAGTDGSRLYLSNGISEPIKEVAISGGEIEPLPIALKNPSLNDVSPDGSTLLVQSFAASMSPATPLYTVRILGGAQRYLVDASSAQWSHDGQLIYYTTANNDLYQMRSDGTAGHKLASLGEGSASWAVSPDSKIVRFARDKKFWEISLEGSNLHELFPGWHPTSGKCCGTWSTNGDFFFFVVSPGSQIWALDERRSLFHRPSGEPFQLTSSPLRWGNVVPDKDGKALFSTGYTSRGELVRHNPKSGQFEPFLNGVSASLVSFSKDGETVAYVSYPQGDLWKVNKDGSGAVQLTNPPTRVQSVNLSPDGTQIAFMAPSVHDREEGWIVSSQGGVPHRLLPEDQTEQTDPSWSPDGSKIIFADSLMASAEGAKYSSIRILDMATHQLTVLPDTKDKFSARWSPDGQSILASSLDISTLNIFDLKTQHWTTRYKGLHAYATWSSDSRFVYLMRYTGSDPAVLKVPAKGGAAEVAADLKGFHYTGAFGLWLGLDPTDAPLLLRNLGSNDVYALTLEQK